MTYLNYNSKYHKQIVNTNTFLNTEIKTHSKLL